MKTRTPKNPGSKYPRVTLRLRGGYPERLHMLRERCGLTPSWVLSQCLTNYLPVIEERHGVAKRPA